MKKLAIFNLLFLQSLFFQNIFSQIPVRVWLQEVNHVSGISTSVIYGVNANNSETGFEINQNGSLLAVAGTVGANPLAVLVNGQSGDVIYQHSLSISGRCAGVGFSNTGNQQHLYMLALGDGNSYFRKLDGGGNPLFSQTINDYETDNFNQLKVGQNGSVFIYGTNNKRIGTGGFQESALYSYNENGSLQWKSIINDLDWYYGYSGKFILDSLGYPVLSGKRQTSQYNPESYDVVIRKLNSSGQPYWNSDKYLDINGKGDFIWDMTNDAGDLYLGMHSQYDRSAILKVNGQTGDVIWKKVTSVSLSPGDYLKRLPYGDMLVAATFYGTILWINPSNGETIRSAQGLSAKGSRIEVDKMGRIYNFGFSDGIGSDSIRVFGPSGSLLFDLSIKIPGSTCVVKGLKVAPDGSAFYVVGESNNGTSTKIFVAKYSYETPLPLTLVDFQVSNQAEGNRIFWSTSNEQNISQFIIQKSSKDQNWYEIQKVTAINRNEKNNYSYLDKYPTSGTIYYRIKILHADGKITYSSIRSISTGNLQFFTISPNPASADIFIQLKLDVQNYTIKLFNASGRNVLVYKGLSNNDKILKLDVKHLPAGVYYLQLQTEGGSSTTKLILYK